MISIGNIAFPVFKLGAVAPTIEDKVSFFLIGKDIEYSDAEYRMLILDDKNRPEPSFALRRLALQSEGITLYKLNKAVFFIADLVKLARGTTWFVDKDGQIFDYQKSMRCKLVFKKISRVTPIATGGAIIEVAGESTRFKTLHRPSPEMTVAGLLLIKNSYVLYGLYDRLYDNTTRMI